MQMDFLLISPGKYQKHLNLSLPNICPDVRQSESNRGPGAEGA